MEDIKTKLQTIIEQAEADKPACKNCVSYNNGCCTSKCVNERVKLTAPNYSCGDFKSAYTFNESTLSALKDLLKDMNRVDEGVKNLELLLSGKIDENEFVNLVD